MREFSYIIAAGGVLVLLVAVVMWARVKKPQKREAMQGRVASRRSRSAAMALVIAFLVCSVAAIAAVARLLQL